MIRFNVEVVTAETGEESAKNYLTGAEVDALRSKMKDGDALVINATEDAGAEEI